MIPCCESVKPVDLDGIPVRPSTLPLVYDLCQALLTEQIDYCHWKSTAALDRSASGENDLDLLVKRADVQRFTQVLYRLGFKEAIAPSIKQMPGVLDFFGYDHEADKLVHVHAHYQLILGDDMTKNYHLPIERPFLESAHQDALFKIPAPEFELIVLVIRMMLKHATWDALISRHGTLPIAARQELEYLQARVDRLKIDDVLRQHLPFIDEVLFDQCLQSLRSHYPILARLKVGHQLQSRLQAHARRAQAWDTGLKLWRRVKAITRGRIFRRLSKRRLASGGIMIALVGGDGAGKSTAVDELYGWLAKNFDVIKVHMGKPPQSGYTFAVRGVSKLTKGLGQLLGRNWSVQVGANVAAPSLLKYLWLIRRVSIARDRCRVYVKARRFATNGGLAICDRYPVPGVSLVDGPQADRLSGTGQISRMTGWLARAEERYYRQIMFPEVLIILKIDPEIAVQRRMDEDAVFVRERCWQIWNVDWDQTPAYTIDASCPKREVLSELKSLIWGNL